MNTTDDEILELYEKLKPEVKNYFIRYVKCMVSIPEGETFSTWPETKEIPDPFANGIENLSIQAFFDYVDSLERALDIEPSMNCA